MNPSWQEFLSASGARLDQEAVADFGDLAVELEYARDATIVSPLVHLGLLECAGDDAKSFLHNQLTSDVNHLPPTSAQHAAWCTAKGRMLASFLLYLNGPDYRALLSSDLLAAIQKRLQMFVLRSKVKVVDLSGRYEVIGLSGPLAETALRSADWQIPDSALGTAVFSGGTIIRLDDARFVLVTDSATAPGIWKHLASHAHPVGTAAWQWLDIRAGVPLVTQATTEAFVPQMANFDKIGGVSFHKGCYPGQEVVARTQYLGKVKRHLYRIHTARPIAAGLAIYPPASPEQPCGLIANAAPAPGGGYDALAVVQEGFVEDGDLRLDGSAGRVLSIVAVA